MAIKHTLILVVSAFFMSATAFAASAPANVKNVQGAMIDGRLTVTWDPPADPATIASYRIYYSHESILGNEGNYDDFVETNDVGSSYVFQNPPLTSPMIFIGVLAVNNDGMESEGFEVEASVVMPVGTAPASEQQPMAQPPISSSSSPLRETPPPGSPPPAPLIITAVEAAGETGVLLTFNKELPETSSLTPLHFQVSDTGGALIPIFTVKQPDSTHAMLVTATQRPDTTYIVKTIMPVFARDGGVTDPNTELRFLSGGAPVIIPPAPAESIPSVPEPFPAEGKYGRNPALPPPAPVANVISLPVEIDGSGTDLPSSGLGLLGILITAGGVAGRMIGRKRSW